MGASDDERIADLEARLWHDDPRFARGLGKGRPRRPREYRRGRAWLAMALALAAIVAGALVPHGLLLATGLVVAAAAVNLLDTRRRSLHGRRHEGPP
ncbi:DUF3040 domain-containing protein [Streptomyces sp. NPDC056527]|uniref:DUF3040 domain-containing protein n=1 Tax=Streptomyces sp. NPDC056527 TaxID=3345853 RepID=UPI0036A23194